MRGYATNDIINELFYTFKTGCQVGLETRMVGSSFAFDHIDYLEYNFNKINLNRDSTYIPLPKHIANKKCIINPKNTNDNACRIPQGSILGPLLFVLYINDMLQAVTCDLLLYADDTCLLFQYKDVIEIETVLNKNLSSLCDWFIDNKLSIHFGEEKTKSILFSSKHKVKKCKPLNIHYKNIKIK